MITWGIPIFWGVVSYLQSAPGTSPTGLPLPRAATGAGLFPTVPTGAPTLHLFPLGGCGKTQLRCVNPRCWPAC